MTPHTIDTAAHDDFDARTRRIRDQILDGIEETLDELARPRVRRAVIVSEVQAQCAALLCRQALCRRAKRCRRTPCAVTASGVRGSD